MLRSTAEAASSAARCDSSAAEAGLFGAAALPALGTMRMPSLPMLMSTPSSPRPFSMWMGKSLPAAALGVVGAAGALDALAGLRRVLSTCSVTRQVKGGMSCTMPTTISSSSDSTMKRRQLMLTNQLA